MRRRHEERTPLVAIAWALTSHRQALDQTLRRGPRIPCAPVQPTRGDGVETTVCSRRLADREAEDLVPLNSFVRTRDQARLVASHPVLTPAQDPRTHRRARSKQAQT